ncbi:MAG TPA: NAD-dependent epimerase/dehydratase family protein [Anaerolineales bacterium]|nr:NAD-dependent epimerase/dehydratase family protein [Anaerolineales bacterium]
MTTYFITGGYGFLGQYIVQAVHEHDPQAELRVLVRTQRKTFLPLEKLERVKWTRGELLKPESFAKQLKGMDTVIHNAAMVSFRKAEAPLIYESNVVGTRNLIAAAREAGCRNFIFISSISAVDFRPPQISDETLLPDVEKKPLKDMYGYSKMVNEMDLQDTATGMRVIILNPSVIIGPGSDRLDMVLKALRFLPILPMLSYVNTFVDVRDVAHAVILALIKGRSGERYIVTAWNMGMIEFTQAVLRATGRKAWIVPLSGMWTRAMDVVLFMLDVLKLNPGIRRLSEMNVDKPCSYEKIKREMGWEPSLTLERSISDTIRGA